MVNPNAGVRVGVVDQGREEKLERYLDELRATGAQFEVLSWAGDPAADAARCDALVLCGGDDVDAQHWGEANHATVELVPAIRDRYEIALVREAAANCVPLLGVCRGSQVMNVALGGTLVQHVPEVPGAGTHGGGGLHEVSLVPCTVVRALAGTDRGVVNSFHHQAVGRLATALRATAHTPDGIVEGVETDPTRGGPRTFFVGVQWHPEREGNHPALGSGLFKALVEAAARTPRKS